MVEHKVVDGKYGRHIFNTNKDTYDTIITYICNLDNINSFKIMIGSNKIKQMVNEYYDLEDTTQVPIVKSTSTKEDGTEEKIFFTVQELSEKIRHRLYHIKHNDKVIDVLKELLSDIHSMVDVKQKHFLIGLDNTKKDISNIYNTIKEAFDILEIKNYTIYVYEGVEKWEEK